MNDLKDIIKNRRSIRKFQNKEVSTEIINDLLYSAKWSPSWGNSQCWELIIIDDEKQKYNLSQTLTKKNPASLAARNAPIVIAICAQKKKSGYYKGEAITKFNEWFMYDLGLVTQNICLTAHCLGLGTVIIGAFNHNKAKKILKLPANYEIVSLLPVGYPAHSPSPTKRRKISTFVHKNHFNFPK
ncbi:MAG: nitroreductase [Desulfobulbaceae bacterium]|nr:MAG: nitroreductase [Desulfobulbaceae bacterium]